MISVSEALEIILGSVERGPVVDVPLGEAVGLYLAEDVVSKYPLPLFDNSAMDGYAVMAADTRCAKEDAPVELAVAGMTAAGGAATSVKGGQAMRIFTGAPVPSGATAVVRQEDVTVADNTIYLRAPAEIAANIRFLGEEVRAGDVLVKAGERITAGAIGVLASAGCEMVRAVRCPTVGLIVTGNELVPLGKQLEPGQIFDSNSHTLAAALLEWEKTVFASGWETAMGEKSGK